MKQIGILWNSMNEYKEMAIADLTENFTLDKVIDLDLGDNLENFIWDVYGNELPIICERVKTKIEKTVKTYDSRTITIILMSSNLSHEELKKVKKNIRAKYSKIVKEYSYDNVFHLTENELEYSKVINAINNAKKVKKLKMNNN